MHKMSNNIHKISNYKISNMFLITSGGQENGHISIVDFTFQPYM